MSKSKDADKPVFTRLEYPEEFRTYHFPEGKSITVFDVIAICVRPSGSHRLESSDGGKWIIPPGWLAIEFFADDWTF